MLLFNSNSNSNNNADSNVLDLPSNNFMIKDLSKVPFNLKENSSSVYLRINPGDTISLTSPHDASVEIDMS